MRSYFATLLRWQAATFIFVNAVTYLAVWLRLLQYFMRDIITASPIDFLSS